MVGVVVYLVYIKSGLVCLRFYSLLDFSSLNMTDNTQHTTHNTDRPQTKIARYVYYTVDPIERYPRQP